MEIDLRDISVSLLFIGLAQGGSARSKPSCPEKELCNGIVFSLLQFWFSPTKHAASNVVSFTIYMSTLACPPMFTFC